MEMPREERIKHLNGLRAHLDANCPGWREVKGDNGEDAHSIEVLLRHKDGTEVTLVLFQKPDSATDAESESQP